MRDLQIVDLEYTITLTIAVGGRRTLWTLGTGHVIRIKRCIYHTIFVRKMLDFVGTTCCILLLFRTCRVDFRFPDLVRRVCYSMRMEKRANDLREKRLDLSLRPLDPTF